MKTILSTNPTFTPGAANTGTLNFSSVNGFNIAGLLAVLNQTTGTLLYATGQASTGYFSWNNSTKVLTLKVDTSSHSSGDQLQVIYDNPNTTHTASSFVQLVGQVTDAVVTSSPAILTSIMAGSNQTGGTNSDLSYYLYWIKSGATEVYRNPYWVNYTAPSIPTGGIYCPNGITASTSLLTGYGPITLARLTITYTLV